MQSNYFDENRSKTSKLSTDFQKTKNVFPRGQLTPLSFFTWGLVLLFIGLKLTGSITWSWWWVFSPVWGPFLALFVVVFVAAFFLSFSKKD